MLRINISEMKNCLSAALAKAEGGETVIICRRNKPIAELKAIAPRQFKERPVGLAAKEYPNWEIILSRCRMTFLQLSMVKRNESAARHLRVSLDCQKRCEFVRTCAGSLPLCRQCGVPQFCVCVHWHAWNIPPES
jgi:antitoxin (DNA-binding transcriptional repressor) of toxin-antitoxin stability system